ncbi:MAG TPA: SAM-dependent methyltransferase [Opitutus sp.]|nr:SAM-dependent methyltransferase [Opitutus sp.]
MGSSPRPDLSPAFAAAFRRHAGAGGAMAFNRFMALALYDPQVGYYRRDRRRVGYGRDTDFFTAATSGPVFGGLVAAACVELLASPEAASFTFVEIGAEPGASILAGVAHPFAGVRTIRVGEPPELSGRCVVFSNELFDAQPFRRFAFRGGRWRELGVALAGGALGEVELDVEPPAQLPAAAPEGYVIDAPLAAADLARTIAAQPWSGLLVACDYGKSWPEITDACPAGTARAYRHHQQSNDLLASPGEQDLTCHICWDWLVTALRDHGFAAPQIDSQEAFFVRHAAAYLAPAVAADATGFSRRKQSLLQLLHPAHLGRKFQVLHAVRG